MFDQATIEILLEGVVDTLYMTLVSTFFSYVFGMMMGTVLSASAVRTASRPGP